MIIQKQLGTAIVEADDGFYFLRLCSKAGVTWYLATEEGFECIESLGVAEALEEEFEKAVELEIEAIEQTLEGK